MRKFFSKFSALIISLIIIGISFYLISMRIMQKGLADSYEDFEVPGISGEIKIYKNEYGVPHIVAPNEHDLFYTMGFLHAQDRYWQMVYNKRAALGTLSEILGKDYVSRDMFMRVMDIKGTAKKIWDSLSPKSKEILIAYSDGVNVYVKNNKNKLSLEFGAINAEPDFWTPFDCIAIMRGFSFELSQNIDLDITMGRIAERVGMQRAMELIPAYPATAPTIVEGRTGSTQPFPEKDTMDVIELDSNMFQSFNDIKSEDILALRKSVGRAPSFGSNAWAIRSKNRGGAILANDPHLGFSAPSKFYQAHLTTGGFNATGLTIPGLPLVIIGRNDNTSWGVTSLMADDADVFVERLDSKSEAYWDPDSSIFRKFEIVEDTIRIKDESTYKFYLRKTKNSFVLNDAFQKKLNAKVPNFYKKYILTYRWTGHSVSDEIYSLYKINKAASGFEIESALKSWKTPNLVFTFADKNSNIGSIPAGAIPLRQGINPSLPNPIFYGGTSWTGYVNAMDLAKSINPDSGYTVAANNKLSVNLPQYVSSSWASPDRAARLYKMLEESEGYNYRDAQFMQIDALSAYAQGIMHFSLPVLKKYSKQFTKTEKRALDLMDDWDFVMSARSVQPSIYNIMIIKMMDMIFKDELGDDVYKLYLSLHTYPQNKLIELIFSDDEYWVDNKKTARVETMQYIILNSFRRSVNELLDRFKDPNPAKWFYGDLNQITLRHTLSGNKLLKPALNLGPRSMNGNVNTVNPASWDFNEPFNVTSGSVARFIADMNENDIYTIIPGGSSGDAMSINYSNQFQLWLSGGFIKMTSARKPDNTFRLAATLKPIKS